MSAPPLLLLPGLLCDAALWRAQTEHFGPGREVRVADMTGADTMAAMAESVLAQAPPGGFDLAGLSMGGYCALEIMRRAPERVRRLALLDTSARPDTDEQRQRRLDLIELSHRGRFRGVTEALMPLFIHPGRLCDKALVAEVTAMSRHVGPEAFRRQQAAIMSRPDSRPGLGQIRCPTLVLCGRQDRLTPVEAHVEIRDAIPGAELVVVEDCGHLATMERPEAVNRAMAGWLGRGSG